MATLAIIILLASVTAVIVVIAVVYMKPKHVVKKLYPQIGYTGGMIYGDTGGMMYGDTMYGDTGGMMYADTIYGDTGGMMYGDTGGMMYADTMYGDTGGMMYGDTGGMYNIGKVEDKPTLVLTNINTSIDTNTKTFYIQSSDTKYFLNITGKGMVDNISEATPFTNNKRQIIFPPEIISPPSWTIVVATEFGWPDPNLLYIREGNDKIKMNNGKGESYGMFNNAFSTPANYLIPAFLVNLITLNRD